MTLPTLVKTWTHLVNQRITYVSLNDATSKSLYGVKNHLVATMGMTVKYTCDGTTGPTSSSDHTDRLASAANFSTQGAAAGNAQSFAVLTMANGVDVLIANQGASADQCKIAFSQTGVYLPAGTANQQPTASDEAIIMTGTTLVGTTTSQDRVWHAQASTDKKSFRFWVYRQNVLVGSFGLEECTSTNTVLTWTQPVVGWNSNAAAIGSLASAGGMAMAPNGSTGTQNSMIARLGATNVAVGGGAEMYFNNTDPFSVAAPEMHAAAPIVTACFAASQTSNQGKLGNRIDAWVAFAHGFAQGDVMGTNQFAFLGTGLWPWNGAAAPIIA